VSEVTVKFASKITQSDGETQQISGTGVGTLLQYADGWALAYTEHAGGERVTLRLMPDGLHMLRVGENHTHIIFSAGETRRGSCVTPYGTLKMNVRTNTITHAFLPGGTGCVVLDYSVDFQGERTHNSMQIACKPKES
jgi:uncharacterized beta-barrel protein YwiB (DUF1934 family)